MTASDYEIKIIIVVRLHNRLALTDFSSACLFTSLVLLFARAERKGNERKFRTQPGVQFFLSGLGALFAKTSMCQIIFDAFSGIIKLTDNPLSHSPGYATAKGRRADGATWGVKGASLSGDPIPRPCAPSKLNSIDTASKALAALEVRRKTFVTVINYSPCDSDNRTRDRAEND